MKKIEYCIFNPGGNLTALVFGNHYNENQKKTINDAILEKHKCLEQVGFVSKDTMELNMAGGEFCGNATRCAVRYYLNNDLDSECRIKVSGIKECLLAGIDMSNQVWVDVPIKSMSHSNAKGFNIVEIEGITHIVVDAERSKKYLNKEEKLKEYARDIINRFSIKDKAVGVLFTEIKDEFLKLYPHCMG
jgi:diaminopimelate epimerase